jgi:hypothetical protein
MLAQIMVRPRTCEGKATSSKNFSGVHEHCDAKSKKLKTKNQFFYLNHLW